MKVLKIIAILVAILGSLGGGIFAILQYYEGYSAKQTKATLEYLERFNRVPLQEARLRLENFWDIRAEIVFARNSASEKELADYVVKSVRESGLVGDIALVVQFFEDLHTCTCEKLCDEALAKSFFAKYAYDFYGLLFPYLVDQRRRLRDESFGWGVEKFGKTQAAGQSGTALVCSK